jgi:co-chaperonin GroES (HSP10)
MKPIGKYIVLKDVVEEIETSSGLVLGNDDVEQLRYRKGTIVKSGTDVAHISEGDIVYYDRRQSFSMMIGGESYTIIRESDVVVVL